MVCMIGMARVICVRGMRDARRMQKELLVLTNVLVFCSINATMNTATGYTRLNITLPKDIAEYVRKSTSNISSYIAETISERRARERREKAFKEIMAGSPSFAEVEDSAEYVRRLRAGDEKRMKRLGL
jgi:post-segregation antitoxin (ccd killing protein)